MTTETVKAYARERMLGNYGKAIAAILTVAALRMIATGIIGSVFSAPGVMMLILSYIASFIIELIGGILTAGLAFIFLKIMYGQDAVSVDVFHAFTEQPDKAVRITLILAIAAQLWEIPVALLAYAPFGAGSIPLLSVIALAGLVAFLYIWLTYYMAFYLLQDFPERSAIELLYMSRELMRGNRWRLFILLMSFLPMFLLSIVAFFIPMLWVSAYMQATQANFYRELMIARRTGAQTESR